MIEKVIETVKEASGLMTSGGFEIKEKDGIANVVTSSDLAVQEFLVDRLAKLLPGSGFLCEEEDVNDLDEEYVWIVDPIDGTQNYSRGIPECCISVALAHRSEVVLGVVYSPGRGYLFSAEKGRGAFLNGRSIHVSSRSFENSLLFTAASTYHKEWADSCFEIIRDIYSGCNDLRRNGSAALEICLMAAGFVELYFEMRLMPWDYAAASLVLHEAGGFFCDFDGSHPSLLKGDMFLAANSRSSLERISAAVHRHMDSLPY